MYASQGHYADHLRPIWLALPADVRGDAYAGDGSSWWGDRLPARYRPTDRLVLVAGFSDAQRLAHVPTVYVEHGAGQTYTGVRHGGYPGGPHPASVMGYLAPSERVADAWRAARPGVPVGVVGCPKLDPWLPGGERHAPGWHTDRLRTVAFTFHWHCEVCPETRSALGHYQAHLGPIIRAWTDAGWDVLGHAHPRLGWPRMAKLWDKLGAHPVEDLEEVYDEAGVLVADNTSALYELAALDRPVVALNAPWYRRDVHHGLRFWNAVPGVQVDSPAELAALDLARYVEEDPSAEQRRAVVAQVYAHTDGTSTARAAAWLVDLLQEGIP